jgi:hypothetical protein
MKNIIFTLIFLIGCNGTDSNAEMKTVRNLWNGDKVLWDIINMARAAIREAKESAK